MSRSHTLRSSPRSRYSDPVRPFVACSTRRRPRMEVRGCGQDVYVAPCNTKKWAEGPCSEGSAGMADRSWRPHLARPRRPLTLSARSLSYGGYIGLGPAQIAGRLGMQVSTVHAVLMCCRINHLSRIDRVRRPPAGHRLRTHRHRRPLERGTRRDLHQREGRHCGQSSAASSGLVRRPMRHHRTGPVR